MLENEALELYDEYLDGIGLEGFILPPASQVLKEVDSTQYDVGFADWCDAEGIEIE